MPGLMDAGVIRGRPAGDPGRDCGLLGRAEQAVVRGRAEGRENGGPVVGRERGRRVRGRDAGDRTEKRRRTPPSRRIRVAVAADAASLEDRRDVDVVDRRGRRVRTLLRAGPQERRARECAEEGPASHASLTGGAAGTPPGEARRARCTNRRGAARRTSGCARPRRRRERPGCSRRERRPGLA